MNLWQKICLAAFAPMIPFWLFLYAVQPSTQTPGYFFSFALALFPLVGGMFALFHVGLWGGLKSAVGKMMFFAALGLLLWGSGGMIWSYYNFFLDVPVPYPSLADLGFAPGMLCYWVAGYYLAQITGAKFALRSGSAKILTVAASVLVAAFAYYMLIVVARDGTIIYDGASMAKIAFDIIYPLGDFVALLLAVIISGLSFSYFGGRYLLDIGSFLAGLAVMFFADSLFSYATTVGTYYNGHTADLLFAAGVFLLTFGVLGFCTIKVPKA